MNNKTIKFALIIENNNDNFNNVKVLNNIGIPNILTLRSTKDALSFLQQAKKEIPQLILLDIIPIKDGFEFLDKFYELKISRQPIDIFILTASNNPADRQKSIRKKSAGLIEKPLTREKLLERLLRSQ